MKNLFTLIAGLLFYFSNAQNQSTTPADDNFTTVAGIAYTTPSVLANDLIGNAPATPSNCTFYHTAFPAAFANSGIIFNTTTGVLTVPATVAPGVYVMTYYVCSIIHDDPQCRPSVVYITVTAPLSLIANPDYFSECISGTDGGVSTSITANDTMNGQPINSNLVTVTLNDTAGLTGLTVSASGAITIPVGTPSGVYIIHYTIKEMANPTNSVSSTVTLCINKSINRGTGTNGTVFGLARQADGKIIIVGKFSTYDGVTRNCIARLNADLSLDTGFDAGGVGFLGTAHAVAIDSNGTIFVGGDFTNTSTGLSVKCLAKLKQTSSPFTNGTVDTTFINNNFSIDGYMPVIYSIVIDANNNIYVGGRFNKIGNVDKKNYAKLNNAGVVFPNYTSAITANDGVVNSIALNGEKLIIGGSYQIGLNSHYLTQLLTDGTVDPSFSHAVGANGTIYSVLVKDTNIFAAGKFDSYNGTTIKNIVKLNSNGSLVYPFLFNPGLSSNNIIREVKLQGTKIIVVGDFTQFGNEQRNHIAALNATGSVYTAFNPGSGASNPILAAIVQPDQKIIIGGSFNEYNETIVNYITRILNTNAGVTGRYASGTVEDEDGKDIIPFASEVTFYPNPAKSTINIMTGVYSDEIFKIKIFNMLGQEVYTSKTLKGDNSSISISNLQSGSYFMILSNDKRSFKKTFIKE